MAGIVEVVAPLQEADDAVHIHQHAHDPVACAGHSQETVGNLIALSAAVVRPQIRHLRVNERLHAVVGGHGMLNHALLVEFQIAQRIDDRAAVQQIQDHLAGCVVVVQLIKVRLVGHMVIHVLLVVALLGQLRTQLRDQRLEECAVHGAGGGNVPAEELMLTTVNSCNDLRRGLRAPLGEKVRDFQILHVVLAAQRQPALQAGEIKAEFAILRANLNQLNRRAFGADGGVQRRGEDGRQDHVDAMVRRGPDEVFRDAPVFLGHGFHAVIGAQAVAVEPLGVDQLLFGQLRTAYVQLQAAGEGKTVHAFNLLRLAVGRQLVEGARSGCDGHVIEAGRSVLGDIPRQPYTAVLLCPRIDNRLCHGLKDIGVQAGLVAKIHIVGGAKSGQLHRLVFHLAD